MLIGDVQVPGGSVWKPSDKGAHPQPRSDTHLILSAALCACHQLLRKAWQRSLVGPWPCVSTVQDCLLVSAALQDGAMYQPMRAAFLGTQPSSRVLRSQDQWMMEAKQQTTGQKAQEGRQQRDNTPVQTVYTDSAHLAQEPTEASSEELLRRQAALAMAFTQQLAEEAAVKRQQMEMDISTPQQQDTSAQAETVGSMPGSEGEEVHAVMTEALRGADEVQLMEASLNQAEDVQTVAAETLPTPAKSAQAPDDVSAPASKDWLGERVRQRQGAEGQAQIMGATVQLRYSQEYIDEHFPDTWGMMMAAAGRPIQRKIYKARTKRQ